jgi:hypothetical protein
MGFQADLLGAVSSVGSAIESISKQKSRTSLLKERLKQSELKTKQERALTLQQRQQTANKVALESFDARSEQRASITGVSNDEE